MSLVDVSPSTVMELKVYQQTRRSISCKTGCSMATSVVRKPSMVAMFGAIMPDPLAMAPSRAVLPPSSGISTATLLQERVGRHDGLGGVVTGVAVQFRHGGF